MTTAPPKADLAVTHILRQMQNDGRLAYLLGEGSRSFELLTDAAAERSGLDLDAFRKDLGSRLRPISIVAKESN